MKVVLIDANALIYRVYHAIPRLSDDLGRPTNALYGLSNILLKFLKDNKYDYIFALFDRPEPTIRHQLFKEYKAQRPKIADDLKIQINLSKKIFDAFGIKILEKPGYEADDLIATLNEKFKDKANEIIILTGDLDTLQLVDLKTKVITMKKGISEFTIYDEKEVFQKYGIRPDQIPDFKVLVGDPSDNIPGIQKIGEKTASQLLKKYENIENIINEAKKCKIDPGLKQKILKDPEKLLFFKNLVTLSKNIDLDLDIFKLKYEGYNLKNLISVFKEFSFKSLIERLEKENKSLSLFSTTFKKENINKRKGRIEELNSPIFIYHNKENELEIFDGFNDVKIFNFSDLEKILLLPIEKIVFDFKSLIKPILKNDFYFDKKINLEKIFDIKLAFWLLNSDKGNFSLEDILSFYRKSNNFYQGALEIYYLIKDDLEKNNLWQLYLNLELLLSCVLARMELRGLEVDFQKLEDFRKLLKNKIEEIKQEIYQLAGRKFNLNSPIELSFTLFDFLKLPTKGIKKTKTGIYSTQENELIKIIDKHPIIEKILNYRELMKLLTTYTESFLKLIDNKSKTVYSNFNQTKTATGRLSSEKPNLQNLPLKGELSKEFRKIFKARSGFVFISADYSQIELRILAHLSQDESLISAFKNDLDIHSLVAKTVFGKETPEIRRKAKIINFGIVYGISPKGLAERLMISISEAKKLIEKFYYFYPRVKEYQERAIDFAQKNLYIETLMGRKRNIPEIKSLSYREKSEAERIAINMPIQGLGADILKKSMLEIDKLIYEKNWQNKAFLVLSIHDELIFEVKEEIKEEFKFIIKDIMENVLPLSVPLKVNISEGYNLGELEK